MKVTVKIIGGDEYSLVVPSTVTIIQVKEMVASPLNVPVVCQKIVFKGKALADDKQLCECGVSDNAKLFLMKKPVQSKPSLTLPTTSHNTGLSVLWDELRRFLRRHFTETDTELVLNEYKKQFIKGLSALSLDDIERISIEKLKQRELAGDV